jgi:DNA-binding XRE family transcriptional regulator
MSRKIVTDPVSRKKIASLRAKGMSLAKIGQHLGVTRQCIHQAIRAAASHRRIRCRVCGCEVNPAGAMPRDDREVFCLACLAKSPDATFGEHLQAYRIAAGLRIVALGKLSGVSADRISAYEHGCKYNTPWVTQCQLFRALGVKLVLMQGTPE